MPVLLRFIEDEKMAIKLKPPIPKNFNAHTLSYPGYVKGKPKARHIQHLARFVLSGLAGVPYEWTSAEVIEEKTLGLYLDPKASLFPEGEAVKGFWDPKAQEFDCYFVLTVKLYKFGRDFTKEIPTGEFIRRLEGLLRRLRHEKEKAEEEKGAKASQTKESGVH